MYYKVAAIGRLRNTSLRTLTNTEVRVRVKVKVYVLIIPL